MIAWMFLCVNIGLPVYLRDEQIPFAKRMLSGFVKVDVNGVNSNFLCRFS